MNLEELTGIDCVFVGCAAFRDGAEVPEVLDFLAQREGEIIHADTREEYLDPLQCVREDPDGDLFRGYGVSFRQRALQPEVYDYVHAAEGGYDPLSRPGAGALSYYRDSRTLTLHQNTDFPDPVQERATKIERVGIGLLQFIYHFAPLLRPAYAYIDAIDADTGAFPNESFRETGEVTFLCWANYFGPAIVAKVGEGFLLEAPGWQRVKLPCGGVLYVVTQGFLGWHFGKHRSHVQYFRQKFPDIEEL
ncbi:MAG: hypothetical protein K2V38_16990 [Gemmataceae bacterium]|nr:hypothetical protein [Gemmataceae bacterium]